MSALNGGHILLFMTGDFIPDGDVPFFTMSKAFAEWLSANGASHGLSAGELAEVAASFTDWSQAWGDFKTAEQAYHSAFEAKETARRAMDANIRAKAGVIQKNPATTDADRAAARLTVPKGTRSRVQVPGSYPIVKKVDKSNRSLLRIFYGDSETVTHSARPRGVAFAEIRYHIGGPEPVNAAAMPLLKMHGRSPFRADFEAEQVGQTVWFCMRWVNTRGEFGPWCKPFSAVVPG